MFQCITQSPIGRRGKLSTQHGTIDTPFFLPVATGGAMRGITLNDLESLGAQALLCNTYHLHLQPGEETVAAAGGLHDFIGWDKPILTDSGGFQVFSLAKIRKIEEHGVRFQSHIDGREIFLGPEEAMHIQHRLGSDMIMCFDECPPSTAPRDVHIAAVDRTIRWAKECKKVHDGLLAEKKSTKSRKSTMSRKGASSSVSSIPSIPSIPSISSPLLFAIVQGGLERDLREKCAQELRAIGFDGFAVGGLAVGETEAEMYDVLDVVCPQLPEDQPRYLMGVGRIDQHRTAVAKGIDMFDCVMPMREARHGKLYLSDDSSIDIRNSSFREDHSIIDPDSPSPLSRRHTKSYLSHLFRSKERSAETIACMQNMAVTLRAMRQLRARVDGAGHEYQETRIQRTETK